MRLSRRVLLWALPGLFAAAACLSPTLPLPPPAPPEVEQVGVGQYRLTGTIPMPGTVLVLNQRSLFVDGKYTKSAYSLVVAAKPGDALRVWYESSEELSDYTDFTIDDALVAPDAGSALPDSGGPPRDAGAD